MNGDDSRPSNIYENLPSDPEQAFLALEDKFRAELDLITKTAHPEQDLTVERVDYIAQVIGAITALGLEHQFGDRVPQVEDISYNTYLNFSKDVKHYRTILLVKHGRRVQGYSVQFDPPTKLKVQHHIEQLREIFQKLEVEEDKREALFNRLNELQQEVDRNRTRFDAFAALAIEAGGVVGEVIEKSKILKLLDGIAHVFWDSKEEEIKRLPPPTPTKRLEPPKAPTPAAGRPASKKRDPDDDIPF